MSEQMLEIDNTITEEDLKQAVKQEKITIERNVELNEFANEVAEQFSNKPVSPNILATSVALIDFIFISTIGLLLGLLSSAFSFSGWQILIAFSGGIATAGFTAAIDGYLVTTLKSLKKFTSKSCIGLGASFSVTVFLTYMLFGVNTLPLYWVAIWMGISLLYIGVSRILLGQYVKHLSVEGRLQRRAIIVGGGKPAAEIIERLNTDENSDIYICGIFDDRKDDRSPASISGYQKLGTISELLSFARKTKIDMLIVTLPLSAEKRILQLLKRLWVLPVDIRLSAHTKSADFRPRSVSYEGTALLVDVFKRPIADWNSIIKRIFDLVFATLAIVLLSPVMIITAIAVKLDSKGPIFFKQIREGFNNEEITIYKFRSLYSDLGDASGVNAVTKGDNRVTRVGRFIRKTSIDELPQFFNVLQGRLSLVGPRPHIQNGQTENRLWIDLVDSYIARHKVKPGITGWAQISGWRGEVETAEKIQGRIDADLYYIENWSLMFDLYILLMTPIRLFNTENAY